MQVKNIIGEVFLQSLRFFYNSFVIFTVIFQKLEDAIKWLDKWESEINSEVNELIKQRSEELNKLKPPKRRGKSKSKNDEAHLNASKEIKEKYKSLIAECKNKFLSWQTSESLRITLRSTIDLSKYLLTSCNFKFVLTKKLNQDCLEVSNIILLFL